MAESDVYCNVVKNLGEVNISKKDTFHFNFYEGFHIFNSMMGKMQSWPFPEQNPFCLSLSLSFQLFSYKS